MASETKRIVIIDDEEDIRFTLSEICEMAGHEVRVGADGEEGYEISHVWRPHLAIVDYHMPGWDGLKTVKKLRKRFPAMAILVLTVDERQEIADRFMDAGATDFAIKPIKAPDLIARLAVNLRIQEVEEKLIDEKESVFLEKGISPATLALISEYFENQEEAVTMDEAASSLNLAYQTVHRYVRHLIEDERLEVIPMHGQVGRPKNTYRWNRGTFF